MRGDANRVGAKSLEERKLKIPTTTNNTLELLSQRGNACSASPELDTSMRPTRPYTRSTPPDLKCLHACSASPELLRQRGNTLAAHLQTSRALEANSYTYLRRLQTSRLLRQIPPRPHAYSTLPSSRSLEANTSTSLRRQCASRVPGFLRQIEATRLQRTSRPLVYQGPQHASGARDLHTGPCPYACSARLELRSS